MIYAVSLSVFKTCIITSAWWLRFISFGWYVTDYSATCEVNSRQPIRTFHGCLRVTNLVTSNINFDGPSIKHCCRILRCITKEPQINMKHRFSVFYNFLPATIWHDKDRGQLGLSHLPQWWKMTTVQSMRCNYMHKSNVEIRWILPSCGQEWVLVYFTSLAIKEESRQTQTRNFRGKKWWFKSGKITYTSCGALQNSTRLDFITFNDRT